MEANVCMPGSRISNSGNRVVTNRDCSETVYTKDGRVIQQEAPQADVGRMQRDTFQRSSAMTQINQISKFTIDSFNRGMSFQNATKAGMDALKQIQSLGPNPVAAAAIEGADHSKSWDDSYDTVRAALGNPQGLDPHASTQQKVSAIAQNTIAAFNSGMTFQNATLVGRDALQQIAALDGNLVAKTALRQESRLNTWNDSYEVLRSALESLR